MTERNYHPLSEGYFSHLVVHGDRCELKIADRWVTFNLQTAEELIDALTGYVQDRNQNRSEYLEALDHLTEAEALIAGFRPLSDIAKEG